MDEISYKISLRKNYWFICPYLILFLILVIFHLCYSKPDIHLFINKYNSAFLDNFFKWITVLGDGFFTMGIVCIFLFFHFRKSVTIFSAFLISGIIVQSLKTTIFSETLRPTGYFEGKATLHYVEGVYQLYIQSFPSGHSASAFALFFCLAAFTKYKSVKFLLLVIASLTAFSRVYLSQHFLNDAMAGSLIGVIVTSLMVYFIYERKPFAFLDNSIIPNQVK